MYNYVDVYLKINGQTLWFIQNLFFSLDNISYQYFCLLVVPYRYGVLPFCKKKKKKEGKNKKKKKQLISDPSLKLFDEEELTNKGLPKGIF